MRVGTKWKSGWALIRYEAWHQLKLWVGFNWKLGGHQLELWVGINWICAKTSIRIIQTLKRYLVFNVKKPANVKQPEHKEKAAENKGITEYNINDDTSSKLRAQFHT